MCFHSGHRHTHSLGSTLRGSPPEGPRLCRGGTCPAGGRPGFLPEGPTSGVSWTVLGALDVLSPDLPSSGSSLGAAACVRISHAQFSDHQPPSSTCS